MTGPPAVDATIGVRTVFIGTGPFAVPVLDALASTDVARLVGVVTAPPRPAGRGGLMRRSPIARRAAELGVGSVLEPQRLRAPDSVAAVAALVPELVVLADYGQIVPRPLLDLPAHGALNLHPSLLPRHRGASPVPATILAGDRETGVTLLVMTDGVDAGPIVAQVAVAVGEHETAPELETALAVEAGRLLVAVLADWLAGRRAPRPQPDVGATLTRPLRRSDGVLDPARDARALERQVRAYQPWPGTFAETAAGRLIVWAARPLVLAGAPPAGAALGQILPDDGGFAIVVGDGALRLVEVQLAGGRRMTAGELRRGHPELVGSRVYPPALP